MTAADALRYSPEESREMLAGLHLVAVEGFPIPSLPILEGRDPIPEEQEDWQWEREGLRSEMDAGGQLFVARRHCPTSWSVTYYVMKEELVLARMITNRWEAAFD
jgi:hypothetical protein